MDDTIRERVTVYYEVTLPWYRWFWYSPRDLALHYGFWDETTRSRSGALLNENRFLAERAKITSGDHILDAGCGVGGSAIWLAKTYGVRVTGISTAPSHIETAKQNAIRNGVSHLVSFQLKDYSDTGFPENTFDVVWAIESFCHAADKTRLFREVQRILKPGGRLIIADGFQKRAPKNQREQKIFNDFIHGLAVFQTQWWDEYQAELERAGFKHIKRWDKTEAIVPSSRHIWWLGVMVFPVVLFVYLWKSGAYIALGNWRAGIAQWRALKKELWLYGVYYAEKPS